MSGLLPDFYLGSTEINSPFEPRKCFILKKLKSEWGPDLLLVKLVPPIFPAPFRGGSSIELEEVIVQPRLSGTTIDPVNHWPLPVHIYRFINDRIGDSGMVHRDDVKEGFWGELYQSLEQAKDWLG